MKKEKTRRSYQELTHDQEIFYSGISNNNLYFHGTPSKRNLRGITTTGLRPPNTYSPYTLAKRISFCDAIQYGGTFLGYIIAFKPKKDEISNGNSKYAMKAAISDELKLLPKERIVFYISGKQSNVTRQLLEEVRMNLNNFVLSTLDQKQFNSSFFSMIETAENLIRNGSFLTINKISEEKIHTLAQEMVWNELCGAITSIAYDLDFITKLVYKLCINGEKDIKMTLDQVQNKLNIEIDIDDLYQKLLILSTITKIKGLGFEDYSYDRDKKIEKVLNWLNSLETKEKQQKETLIDKIIRRFVPNRRDS